MPEETTDVRIEELPAAGAIESQDGANVGDAPRDGF